MDNKFRLSADELEVSSFPTEQALSGGSIDRLYITIKPTTDPTANTWCYICPEYPPATEI
jgi:hypothetical protein